MGGAARRLTVMLLVTLAPLSGSAQTVESLGLPGAPRVDGITISPSGEIFGAGTYTGSDVYRIHPDGRHDVIATGIAGPTDLDLDAAGNLYVSAFNGRAIYRITPAGDAAVHAEVPAGPAGVVVDPDGTVFVAQYGTGNGTGRSITRVDPDGRVSEFASDDRIAAPIGLTRGPDGALYVANFYDGRIFRIGASGEVSAFARIYLPNGSPAPIGHLSSGGGGLVATTGRANRLYRVGPDGQVSLLAGDGSVGGTDGPVDQATFHHPNGIAEASDGGVYVATAGNGPGDQSVLRRVVFMR